MRAILGAALLAFTIVGGAGPASAGGNVGHSVSGPVSLSAGSIGEFAVSQCPGSVLTSAVSIQAIDYSVVDGEFELGEFNDGTIEVLAVGAGPHSLNVKCVDVSGRTPVLLSQTVNEFTVSVTAAGPAALDNGALGAFQVNGCVDGRRIEATDFVAGRLPAEYTFAGSSIDGVIEFASAVPGPHSLIFECFDQTTGRQLGGEAVVDVVVGDVSSASSSAALGGAATVAPATVASRTALGAPITVARVASLPATGRTQWIYGALAGALLLAGGTTALIRRREFY